jgi:hypothetical protein
LGAGLTNPHVKKSLLPKLLKSLGPGRILWINDPSYGIRIGRPRCRWVNNIRMDLGEMGWGDVDWIGLAKDRIRWRALVNSV